jgi:hypothetical protein
MWRNVAVRATETDSDLTRTIGLWLCLNGVERKTEGNIRVPNMRFGVVIWEMALGRYWGRSFGVPNGGKTPS